MECKKKRKDILKNTRGSKHQEQEILSIKVTDEQAHDGKVLPELVDNIIKSDNIPVAIGKLFADDGAYDSNDIFDICPQTFETCLVLR